MFGIPDKGRPQIHRCMSGGRGLPQAMLGHIALKNQGLDPLTFEELREKIQEIFR